ncbi:hypothetical protein [Aliivibrio sp. 1S128]|uniref:hypothetical protein n=1 Tax=Aliivibrio sp. 1S128 TaxID=1840085 RepID=UPI00080E82C6|nr:hypothetical protein [Aliivibrio sp. 1S128]OCH12423.1 hypothetical protein A6E03_18745 [Aliivibrio sp. 1S128]
MKFKIISILVFSIGIVFGAWFGINHVVIESESIPTKSFFDLLSLSLSFGGFVFAGLSFAIAYHVFSEWKIQHKDELITELKTDAIDRMLKCHAALTNFTYHKSCKETSIAFTMAITDLQSVNMRYFSMLTLKNQSTLELLACDINNDQMQFAKDYASLMSHFFNGVKRDCISINGRVLTFSGTKEGITRKGVLEVYIKRLDLRVTIENNQLDLHKFSTEAYLAIVSNCGNLVEEAYSNEERI